MIQIEDIYDIIESPKLVNYKFIILGIILFFVFLIILILFLKKIKIKQLTPEQLALKQLSEILPEKYFIEKQYDIFYEKLSGIIKNYFTYKTGVMCTSMSDIEFCEYLEGLKNIELAEIITLFKNFEKIKFARHEAIKQQMLDDLEKIKKAIKID